MAFLRLQSSENKDDRIVRFESQLALQVRGRLPSGVETIEIATVPNDMNLRLGQALLFNQVPSIRLRNSDEVIDKTAQQSVKYVCAFDPTRSPVFTNVRRFHNQWHIANPADWRTQSTSLKHV